LEASTALTPTGKCPARCPAALSLRQYEEEVARQRIAYLDEINSALFR
jgi:hypothetical protein